LASVTTQYPNALPIGSSLMEYRLDTVLGVGGFGITYLAHDTLLQKDVAIKEYFPGASVSRGKDQSVTLTGPDMAEEYAQGLERFLKEARTLAGFAHPNIVRVNRYFKANGTAYMVMDYVEGESLKAYLKRYPQPPIDSLRALLAPLLDGLEKVHAAGFLHRDIKPDNIFVREGGDPVLIDFGSARASAGQTRTLTTLVTPGYAPFEQYASGAPQGPWTDLYAMGGVMFYATTGRNPPDAIGRMKGDALETLLAPAKVHYDEQFLGAISWAMAIDEKRRPQSVAEWRERILGPQLDLAPADSTRRPVPVDATQKADSGEAQQVAFNAAFESVPVKNEALLTGAPDTQGIGKLLEQREQLERAMREKFQRVLTVMFTDLKGSTAIAETSGDIVVRGMLKIYHDLCTESVRAQGGTLVKTIGDGSLSHFTDALAACRAAAAIQRGMEQLNISKKFKTLLLARIGLHTGECILEKNDIFGDVVNTAARFESAANPGEILISEDTYNALSDKSEFYSRFDRNVSLKGKANPFKAYIVFWDPKEIEIDRARPAAAAKPSTPVWKIAAFIAVPLIAIGATAWYITAGGKIGGETTRSINYSVPTK
jgi:serine/threonine protein kinase/class 3 adenylate cyclase